MYNYFPPQYRRPVGIGLIIAGLIVLYFIIKSNAKLSNTLGLSPEAGADKSTYNKGNLRPGFNPVNQAVAIADYLKTGWDSDEDDKAFNIILDLNDDELRAVHNAWLEKYKGVWSYTGLRDTLRKQVTAETVAYWRKDTVAKKKKVLARLDKLNL